MNRGTTVSRTRDFHVLGVLETVSDIIRWRVQRGGEGVPPRETWGLFFKKQRRIIHLNPYIKRISNNSFSSVHDNQAGDRACSWGGMHELASTPSKARPLAIVRSLVL